MVHLNPALSLCNKYSFLSFILKLAFFNIAIVSENATFEQHELTGTATIETQGLSDHLLFTKTLKNSCPISRGVKRNEDPENMSKKCLDSCCSCCFCCSCCSCAMICSKGLEWEGVVLLLNCLVDAVVLVDVLRKFLFEWVVKDVVFSWHSTILASLIVSSALIPTEVKQPRDEREEVCRFDLKLDCKILQIGTVSKRKKKKWTRPLFQNWMNP